MFDINKFMTENRVIIRGGLLVKKLVCKNGLTMSVQASFFHYCSPREDSLSHYDSVEVGYPSRKVDALMEYAERPETPTETVYGWVPVDVINKIVDENGGLSE
jgi:hypothetical protein